MPESMMQPDLQDVATPNGVQAAALARWQETRLARGKR